ncbi:low-specificity L-threonine aldolase [Tumebacillus permanentifrigoris]|uniref:L-threonine aldolase n=1 Tax=Tumebacillus permanentifrigoris TaxID=378543 RepID=A0A316D4F9_9BACL|nr:low-specificity L-threonine aldolase [Tumebacillus permanentifrigoris]PWK05117.1 L-threonine aldolase [Tumebacillus permanentifrigoris]
MSIDLRSDTVTKPSEAMRQSMYNAEVGDDVYGEDPTVHRLEETAAEILGKEASLFVTSGTMGNQIAVLVQARSGEEILLEEQSHIFLYEAATHSAFAGVQTRTIKGVRGAMNPEDVRQAIRPVDIHQPRTSMICVENTHNKAGGAVVPAENMRAIYEIAREHSVAVHLDGARLFNTVVASGGKASDFTQYVDTVQVCFSKGLGAPIGSILAGDRETIERARIWRKRMGGGTRQVGVIAAPALLALTQNVERLAEDHANAKHLAEGLAQIKGMEINPDNVDTNIVIVDVRGLGISDLQLIEALKQAGILCGGFGPGLVRFVTHLDVTRADIDTALATLHKVVRGAQ